MNTDISIVSGTYNRIEMLKQMVETARQSFVNHYGLRHEFVIVDGGSTDGTQDWIEAQSDIRLIQHTELLGAVKAFNDGAYAAKGNYVILANDDITFVGESILTAWLYMQENKECGIGCFYQDRNGRDWHVENMSAERDGKIVSVPYGQICIVPKWLGDQVGWWGNYLRTYGGDNELSCLVYELGFKVSPVPGAKIHDLEAKDDLRRLNNDGQITDPLKNRGQHPDSFAWGQKWKRRSEKGQVYVGPKIREGAVNYTEEKERILYLPVFELGFDIQKEQKRGLRDALAKDHFVMQYDYVQRLSATGPENMFNELLEICHKIHPTIIFTQIHNANGPINANYIRRLKQANPTAKFINWNGDFWPQQLLNPAGVELAKEFDWQLIINRAVIERYKALGVNAEYWQIGFEPDGVGHKADRSHDVVFLANGYSPARLKFGKRLRNIPSINLGLYGAGWPKPDGQCTYDFATGCKIYQGAKISLGDNQFGDSGFVSNRVFQALAAGGAMLAHQWFKDMELEGLVDGETCVIWRTFTELKNKIRYYLKPENEPERKAIAEAGQKLALERHSFDVRVKQLFELINNEDECWR